MSKGSKLLDRARRSQAGWQPEELKRLYRAYGFEIRIGSNHDIIEHPDYPLTTALPRHKPVAKVYIRIAVELIDKLQAMEREADDE